MNVMFFSLPVLSASINPLSFFSNSDELVYVPVFMMAAFFFSIAAVLVLAMVYVRARLEIRKLRAAGINMSALLGIAELDYFIMDAKGEYLLHPHNSRCWNLVNGKPVSPEKWIIPEDLDIYKYKLQQLLDGHQQYLSLTYRVEFPEGRGYFVLRAMPVTGGRGERCFVGTIHEITSARKNEQEYHDMLVTFQTIMDNLPCPIYTREIGGKMRMLTVNRAVLQQIGKPMNEVVDHPLAELFPDEREAEEIRNNDLEAVRANGKIVTFREHYTGAEGKKFFSDSYKKTITYSNGKRVMLGISIDVTQAEYAKRHLAKSEQKLRETNSVMQAILDSAPVAIWVKDPASGKIVLGNRCMSLMFSGKEEQVTGRCESEIMAPELAAAFAADDAKTAEASGGVCSYEHQQMIDGRVRSFRVMQQILRSGSSGHLLSLALDVTEQAEALARAEEANRTKDFFFAGISHELRTPLHSIIGFCELMRNRELSREEQLENLKAIDDSGKTLLDLINDIIHLSRLEAEDFAIESGSTDIAGLLGTAVHSFMPRCQVENTELKLVFSPDFPHCLELDGGRIRQIAFTLIEYAVSAGKGGKVAVSVSFLPSAEKHDSGVFRLVVSDSGAGLSAEDCNEIFTPFMRKVDHVPGSRSYREHSGLELPIIKKIVEKLGGTIAVESELEIGTRFTVVFSDVPVPATTEAGQKEAVLAPSDIGAMRILIVDDVPMNLQVLKAMLIRLGVSDIISCSSAVDALDSAEKLHPSLILADFWMPDMKGDELAGRLRENPDTFGIPVVAITADAGVSSACFSDVMIKPVTLNALRDVLSYHLLHS